ncbi:hypothetical protein ACWEN3_30160 [Streptomyces sp. NPDC004561]
MSEKDPDPPKDRRPSTDELLGRLTAPQRRALRDAGFDVEELRAMASAPGGEERVRAIVGEFTDSGERLTPVDWPVPPEGRAPLRLVVLRWSQLLAFDLAAVAATGLAAVKIGRWPAVGTYVAFTLLYVLWLRRRMPRSPGRRVAGIVAALGYAVLIIGAGYGTPRVYLDAWGKEGTATVVDQNASRTRDGGEDHTCTVTLPNGDRRQLQASSHVCAHLEPIVADRVPVVYDPAHVVLPMAGTKGQLDVAKSVLAPAIGLSLVVAAVAHAVVRTAVAGGGRLRAGGS